MKGMNLKAKNLSLKSEPESSERFRPESGGSEPESKDSKPESSKRFQPESGNSEPQSREPEPVSRRYEPESKE